MEFEESHRLGILGYDEKTETWFVQSRESQRLILTRQSLGRLVQMYNSIHKGNSLALVEQRELRKLEESRLRHSEILRDLCLHAIDSSHRRQKSPGFGLLSLVRRLAAALRRRARACLSSPDRS